MATDHDCNGGACALCAFRDGATIVAVRCIGPDVPPWHIERWEFAPADPEQLLGDWAPLEGAEVGVRVCWMHACGFDNFHGSACSERGVRLVIKRRGVLPTEDEGSTTAELEFPYFTNSPRAKA